MVEQIHLLLCLFHLNFVLIVMVLGKLIVRLIPGHSRSLYVNLLLESRQLHLPISQIKPDNESIMRELEPKDIGALERKVLKDMLQFDVVLMNRNSKEIRLIRVICVLRHVIVDTCGIEFGHSDIKQ